MFLHDIMPRDAVVNTATANGNGTGTHTKNIWTRSISLINVCLRCLSAVYNFDRKTKSHCLLKYDKYCLTLAYRLEAAWKHVSDIKANGRIDSPASKNGTSGDGMAASVRAVAST